VEIKVTRINYDGTAVDVTADAVLVPLSGDVTVTDGRVSGHGSFAFAYQTRVAGYTYALRSHALHQ
jgi:hypothetical protein